MSRNKGGRGKKTDRKIRVLQGNPSGRVLPNEERHMSIAVDSQTEPPVPLGERAREHWDRIVSVHGPSGLITTLDLDSLARYCSMLEKWQDARDFIQEHGCTTTRRNTYQEYEVKSPEFDMYLTLGRMLLQHAQQFGFTPASRQPNTNPPEVKEMDEMEEFLFGNSNTKKMDRDLT